MPLLWKKRNQKIPAPVTCANVASCIEEEQVTGQESSFNDINVSFVVQDFNASLHDEISVRRGQVIQVLNNDDNDIWLYVCNVDGQCGYIPASVSYPINHIQSITGWSNHKLSNIKPKATSMDNCTTCNNVLPSRLNSSSAFPCNNLPTSPNLSHIKAGNGNTTGTTLSITELSSSPRFIAKYHPLHPLSLSNSASDRNANGGSNSSRQDIRPYATPVVTTQPLHTRTQSYQDAITEPQYEERVLPNVTIERPSRPCNLPLYSTVTCDNNCLTTTTEMRTYTNGSQYDDVFLPSNKKPVGIFKTLTNYDKTVPGEVTVLANEYVIVTELGQGEWAWIITASNTEGVVPKNILFRYDSNEIGVSIGTQTELIVVAPVSTRPLSTSPPRRHSSINQSSVVAEVAVQTDTYSPEIMDVWSRSQTVDDLWYENSMSLPRLNMLSLNGIDSPSICTLPAVNGLHHDNTLGPCTFHSSHQSLPQLPSINRQNGISSEQIDRQVTTHIIGDDSPGLTSNCNNEMQTVVLKATQSYAAMRNSNYLSIKKGDILHVSPGNNTVCQGWIWAYHVQQKVHGYVPKVHTAFLCITKHCGVIRYDEV